MILHHHMRIGAAHAECADRTDTRPLRFLGPGLRPLVDVERALPPPDVVVLLLAMQTGRYGFMPDSLDKADHADEPGRGKGMAEIALGRRQGTVPLLVGSILEDVVERVELPRIAPLAPGATCPHIVDVLRAQPRQPEDPAQQLRRGKA